jgi:hypothetical protein
MLRTVLWHFSAREGQVSHFQKHQEQVCLVTSPLPSSLGVNQEGHFIFSQDSFELLGQDWAAALASGIWWRF